MVNVFTIAGIIDKFSLVYLKLNNDGVKCGIPFINMKNIMKNKDKKVNAVKKKTKPFKTLLLVLI